MSIRYVVVDRDTPMLLPPRLQDWLPEGHLVQLSPEPEDTSRTKKRGMSFFSTGVAAQTSADFKPLFAAGRSVNEGVRSSSTGC